MLSGVMLGHVILSSVNLSNTANILQIYFLKSWKTVFQHILNYFLAQYDTDYCMMLYLATNAKFGSMQLMLYWKSWQQMSSWTGTFHPSGQWQTQQPLTSVPCDTLQMTSLHFSTLYYTCFCKVLSLCGMQLTTASKVQMPHLSWILDQTHETISTVWNILNSTQSFKMNEQKTRSWAKCGT